MDQTNKVVTVGEGAVWEVLNLDDWEAWGFDSRESMEGVLKSEKEREDDKNKEAMKNNDECPLVVVDERVEEVDLRRQEHHRSIEESKARIAFYDQLLQEGQTVNKAKIEAYRAWAMAKIDEIIPRPTIPKAVREIVEEDRRMREAGESGSAFEVVFKEEIDSMKRQIEAREGFSIADIKENILLLEAAIVKKEKLQCALLKAVEAENELIQLQKKRRAKRREESGRSAFGSPASSVASFTSSSSGSSVRVTSLEEGSKTRLKCLKGKLDKCAKDVIELEEDLVQEGKKRSILRECILKEFIQPKNAELKQELDDMIAKYDQLLLELPSMIRKSRYCVALPDPINYPWLRESAALLPADEFHRLFGKHVQQKS